MIVVFYFRLTPNLMVLSNFVMPSSDCTAQKRNQLLSCNSTEKRVPLAEMAASLTLRLISVEWKCGYDLKKMIKIKKYQCKEAGMQMYIDIIGFTNLSYYLQEYIFVHPRRMVFTVSILRNIL